MKIQHLIPILFLAAFCTVSAQTNNAVANTNKPSPAVSNGLYYVSSHEAAQTKRNANETTMYSYEKADIQILKAHVYSANNSNTDFRVYLDTSYNPFGPKPGSTPKPMALRIGNHTYSCEGFGGNTMMFPIHNQDEAKIAAKWLSVDCTSRTPPNYKVSSQFVLARAEVGKNEPVLVDFVMTNLDERTIVFQDVNQAAFQFDFQATLNGLPQPNKRFENDLMSIFNGPVFFVSLEPGKEFNRQVDLKDWFAFVKAGTYRIHGSFELQYFYKPGETGESHKMWNEMWSDNASADFTVIIK